MPKKIKQDDPFYNIELSSEPKYNINVFHINPENFYLLEMNYSKDIDEILRDELTVLINKVRNKEFPFNNDVIKKYYLEYKKLQKVSNK